MSSPSSPSLSDLFADEQLDDHLPEWLELQHSLSDMKYDLQRLTSRFERTAQLVVEAQKAQDTLDDALFIAEAFLKREEMRLPAGPQQRAYAAQRAAINKARNHPYLRFRAQ